MSLGSGAQTGGFVGQCVGGMIVISGTQVGAGTGHLVGLFVGFDFGYLDGLDRGHLVGFFRLSSQTGFSVG